jgi:hypothetical protein
MAYSSGIEIIASKAIEYMRLRLSAEKTPSIDVQFKGFEDIDKMIEHMRSQLKPSFQQQYRDDFHHGFNLTQVRTSNVDLMSTDCNREVTVE